MTREFVWTSKFLNHWKDCGFSDDDRRILEAILCDDPKYGDVIEGTNGARKFRFAYEGRGKSGSSRVIYVDFEVTERICALDAYLKADKGSLTKGEKNELKKEVDRLKKEYG